MFPTIGLSTLGNWQSNIYSVNCSHHFFLPSFISWAVGLWTPLKHVAGTFQVDADLTAPHSKNVCLCKIRPHCSQSGKVAYLCMLRFAWSFECLVLYFCLKVSFRHVSARIRSPWYPDNFALGSNFYWTQILQASCIFVSVYLFASFTTVSDFHMNSVNLCKLALHAMTQWPSFPDLQTCPCRNL